MEISLSKLSTKDLATLSVRVITISDKAEYAFVSNHPLLQNVKTSYADYDKVYVKDTFSGLGVDVKAAKKVVGTIFDGIKTNLYGNIKDPESVSYQFSKDLYAVLEKHGLHLHKYNNSSQPAQMTKFIEEMELPENQTRLEAVHLSDNFNRLKIAQNNFLRMYNEEVKINAQLRDIPSASSIRSVLELSLRKYFNLMSAMENVEDWKSIYKELDEVVKAARKTYQGPAPDKGTKTEE